jgi:hypothetical protein
MRADLSVPVSDFVSYRSPSGDVAYWHECEVPTASRNVRVRRRNGRHLLGVSISHFDPKPTFGSRSAAAQHSVDNRPDQWRLLSDAAISMKSGLFETLQHMVVRCLRAELRGKPLSV